MKPARLALGFAIILVGSCALWSQTAPNFENGWKPYGSYDGSHLDTVNLMNGNLMLHVPLPGSLPQRGSMAADPVAYVSSKDWQAACTPDSTAPTGKVCRWQKGGTGVTIQRPFDVSIHRTLTELGSGTGTVTFLAAGYTVISADGASHKLYGVPGTEDATDEATQFESTDLTGYQLQLSNVDINGVMSNFTLIDRHGTVYQGAFPAMGRSCEHLPGNELSGGSHAPLIDDAPFGTSTCSETGYPTSITDSNGNHIDLSPIGTAGALNLTYTGVQSGTDTLGRVIPPLGSAVPAPDPGACASAHPIVSTYSFNYQAPDGTVRQAKFCTAEINIQTAFNISLGATPVLEAVTGTLNLHFIPIVSIVLADGTHWTFDYDSYGELIYVGLPTGGSITYTWTTINFISCTLNPTPVSRAVATRTLDDGQGHTSIWRYQWGSASSAAITNVVSDAAGNDVVHAFTTQGSLGCNLFESGTTEYQGSQSANHVMRNVTMLYSSIVTNIDFGDSGAGSVFATDITTTVYPSGKVKKVHKDPDVGPGSGLPIFGNVKKELEYDWGQGAPGPLLRETDTTYKWEANPAYLTAHLLDLPAAVIVKDGSGNRVAETDYAYDEAAYLTTSSVSTQHVVPPYTVRGNQSTVSHWLNTTNGFISSYTNWYDTGEVYQKTDPLGHTTTYSYDPAYAGAYATETCSPTTNSVAHCVSGTYDFNTGVLTSLTNENATAQASGNSPGDSAHTSTYSYDFMFRLTSGQAPPDPANGSARATNSFTFSAPGSLPLSVQRTKSVTNALSDTATSFFDGLGRSYTSQHLLPNGTAKVDTTFDADGHPATVSNPYFSTADPTYGITASLYDALDRVTQVTKQDGSISSVSYNVAVTSAGDCTDTVDEVGHQRRTCSDALGRLVEVDEPNPGSVATPAQATVTVSGALAVHTGVGFVAPSSGVGSVTITGQGPGPVTVCNPDIAPTRNNPCPGARTISDHGTVTLTVNGHAYNAGYTANQSATTTAGGLATAVNTDAAHLLTASSSGAVLTLQATTTGAATNYSWSVSSVSTEITGTFGPNAFRASPGSLAGGSDGFPGITVWDKGTITLTVGGFQAQACYGQSGDCAPVSGCSTGSSDKVQVACKLAAALNATGSPVSVQYTGDETLTLVDKTAGAAGNELSASASGQSTQTLSAFPPSFASDQPAMANAMDPGDLSNAPFVTLYQYDALGNLLRVDQKGAAPSDSTQWRTRTFVYDSLSRLLTANNPESGTISYAYDADGSLLQKTSPAANQTGTATQTVSYCYDELHRVTGKGYGAQSCPLSSPVVSYAYDSGANAKGKLVSLIDQAGTASYAYDTLGRMTTETRTLFTPLTPPPGTDIASVTKTLSYSYNLDGSLKSLTYPSNAVVTYTPDSAGRTLSAVDSGNGINYITGATYGPDSGLTGFISGNSGTFAGITNAFSYNKRLQPVNMAATSPSQTLYSVGYDFHYGAGNNGNVFGIYNYRDRDRDQSFTYDALNRLVSAQNAGTDCTAATVNSKTKYWGNSYAYDAWGNLLQKSITKCGAENLSVTADAHNWIHTSGTDYQYDAAGNMTYDATASLNYTFDKENRITGANGYTYTYDGDGNRVEKVDGAAGTLYWYMMPGIVAESDLAGTTTSEYVFFGGERVARKDFSGGTTSVSYYFSDHLKTASVITDAAGNIKAESDFYPWGGELQFTNNDSNHYKFTGKERDGESGLDYFGARYYSGGLGRWVSADWSPTPIPVPYADFDDPQSLNLYGFVGGNPASKADPDGHCLWCPAFEELAESPAGQAIEDWAAQTVAGAGTLIGTAATALSGGRPPAGYVPGGSLQDEKGNSIFLSKDSNLKSGDKPAPNPDGSKGAPDHQQTAEEERQSIGPDGKREVKVDTPDGEKGHRKIDVAKVENGKVTEARQVIRPNKDGTPPAREVRAANDIENATGIKPKFVPVRPIKKQDGQ